MFIAQEQWDPKNLVIPDILRLKSDSSQRNRAWQILIPHRLG